ncbi:MAG: prepilin-type N-terminal cleavage/methylation domain-containing protein [Opitutae bacterium]|nr:prepilin-type N-terminal cleavage/methylation domain-containing protein [Opitutae bacterium]
MTTTTLSPIREPRRPRGGFTLVEVMISAGLGAILLAGVMSTFLFMGRSGANFQNYSDMESQARKALETFAEDARQADTITWNSNVSIRLTVNTVVVVYEYDSSTATFYRRVSGSSRALITGITASSFAFKAYNVNGTDLPLTSAAELATATSTTKQLQISLEATRTSQTVVAATNSVLSARYILRNKVVTA